LLEDISKLKVFYSLCDIQSLQRDFRIFPVSAMNMQEVYAQFHPSQKEVSFSNMIKCFFDIELDKIVRLADWRIRPLHRDMIQYASNDTHFLLRCWDHAKELAVRSNFDLVSFQFPQSIKQVGKLYMFPKIRNPSCV